MPLDPQLRDFLGRVPLASSRDIQRALGISQASASRLIRGAGDAVVRVGRGPATRYALGADALGVRGEVSVFSVDDRGTVSEIAVLRGLSGGRHLLEPIDSRTWLMGADGAGLHGSVPYFLEELRPSGFLGRQIGRRLALEWGLPEDPRNWRPSDLGRYLLERGDDLPGNLLVGSAAAERVARRSAVEEVEREEYPALAEQALGEGVPGSSAAGEQPKFAVFAAGVGHVIVKFSPPNEGPESRRWRDLLRAEWQAGRVLREAAMPGADSTLRELGGRVFLESARFDRVETLGRRGAISLLMVDAEFVADGRSWGRVASGLRDRGLLSIDDARTLVWLETFGRWIGNTDMHLGNVSLRPTSSGFELLPVYDMLPMLLAPQRGELLRPTLRPPVATAGNREAWHESGRAAATFWGRLAADEKLADEMRRTAEEFAGECRRATG